MSNLLIKDATEIRRQIGLEIRSIRQGRGLTLDRFVKKFNDADPRDLTISRSSLHKYETGDIRISAEKFQKILTLGD